jgi:hypothetical protein
MMSRSLARQLALRSNKEVDDRMGIAPDIETTSLKSSRAHRTCSSSERMMHLDGEKTLAHCTQEW